jgi:hypothetical protein
MVRFCKNFLVYALVLMIKQQGRRIWEPVHCHFITRNYNKLFVLILQNCLGRQILAFAIRSLVFVISVALCKIKTGSWCDIKISDEGLRSLHFVANNAFWNAKTLNEWKYLKGVSFQNYEVLSAANVFRDFLQISKSYWNEFRIWTNTRALESTIHFFWKVEE